AGGQMMMQEQTGQGVRLDKYRNIALLGGVVLLAISALLLASHVIDPARTLQSYFYAWIYWICVTLGCFGLTLLHHSIRGSWGLSILRVLEAGGGALNFVLMALLFIPIVLNMGG